MRFSKACYPMGADVRTPSLLEVVDRLNERFDASVAAGMNEVYQFYIPDAGNYYLTIADGNCQLSRGECRSPSVILSMDLEVLLSILDGTFSGMQAFMFGKVRVQGDMRLATKLSELFSS